MKAKKPKMEGWIGIHRQVMENPMYFSEPFTRMQAWFDLLLLANHGDNYFFVRGNKVNVKRGQCAHSQETLASRWKWSRGKIVRFFKELEKDQQIVQQKSRITSVISIVNYEQYQFGGTTDGQQTVQQTDINNNDNNDNKKNTSLNTKGEKSKKIVNTGVFKEKKGAPAPRDLVIPLGFDDRFQALWRAYHDYRVAERKGWYRDGRSEQSAVNNFWDICGGDFGTAEKILTNTISNRWTGLFPIKNQQSNGKITTENLRSGNNGKATSTISGIISATDF